MKMRGTVKDIRNSSGENKKKRMKFCFVLSMLIEEGEACALDLSEFEKFFELLFEKFAGNFVFSRG